MATRGPIPPDTWKKAEERWPVIARGIGVAGGFLDFVYAGWTHTKLDPIWLGWCTGLLLAPNVFPGKRQSPPPAEVESPPSPSSDA